MYGATVVPPDKVGSPVCLRETLPHFPLKNDAVLGVKVALRRENEPPWHEVEPESEHRDRQMRELEPEDDLSHKTPVHCAVNCPALA